jgi:hypothetical protein
VKTSSGRPEVETVFVTVYLMPEISEHKKKHWYVAPPVYQPVSFRCHGTRNRKGFWTIDAAYILTKVWYKALYGLPEALRGALSNELNTPVTKLDDVTRIVLEQEE